MDFKVIIFWVLLLLFTLPGFYFGYAKAIATAEKLEHFKRLGIGVSWMRLLGIAEITANLLLIFTPTRWMGFIAWTVILLGANYFNIVKKEPREELYASLGCLVLLGVIYWLQMPV